MIINRLNGIGKETVGGKAQGLLILQAKGFRVPDFFVLPASAFSSYLARRPNASVLTDAHKAEVIAQLERWNWRETGVAVRSSVADEDGSAHAFPGMMDSFLNVKDEPRLWQAIANVVNSAWSERAVAYRQEKQITGQIVPAVVIQQQINAEISGVVFTVNPTYPDEMAIHTVTGLGVGLVGGEMEPTEVYLDRNNGKVLHQQTRILAEHYVPAAGSGIERVKGDSGQLSPSRLADLYQTSRRVEKQMETPQDIEFCVADGLVYLLQSRPITVPIADQVVYDNSNIQESYCGVTTPLTFSFAQRAYATVYTQTMQVLGLPSSVVRAHQEMVNNLLGLVKGRIYYNINQWYRGLQLLPSFQRNKADMERMMGLQEPVDFVEDQRRSFFQRVDMLPRLIVTFGRLLYRFSRLNRDVGTFQAYFTQQFDQFYAQPLSAMCPEALWQQKEWLDQQLLCHWATPIINDFYVMMKNGSALRILKKSAVSGVEETLKSYLSGDLEIDSLKPALELMALAGRAKQDSALCALLSTTLPTDCHDPVATQFPDFFTEVERYIHRYGDRTVGELKLETITMRVAPAVFYRYLRNYLSVDITLRPTSPSDTSSGTTQLRKKLMRLKKGIQRREAMRLERTRLFGMYRTLYILMGERLVQQGTLSETRDIFYLEEGEIRSLIQSAAGFDRAIITERKQQAQRWEEEVVPSRVIVPSRPTLLRPSDPDQHHLRGEPCVPGRVSGEAVVISRPDDDLAVQDKIICALRTDPGWAALFPVCKAVLIEKGSSLSHSVILLRELGVPTIINIPGLTQSITTGATIELDAGTGEITKQSV